MVTEYLLSGHDSRRRDLSLNGLADHYGLDRKEDVVASYWKKGVDTYDIPATILDSYVRQDCRIPLELFNKQEPLVDSSGLRKVVDLQNEFTLCLSDMECNGFRLDEEKARDIAAEYLQKSNDILEEVRELAGEPYLNLGSNDQKSALLYGGLLKTKRKEWVVQELKVRPESYYKEREIKEEHEIKGFGFKPLPRTQNKNGYYSTKKDTIIKLKGNSKEQRHIKKLLLEFSEVWKVVTTIQGKKSDRGLLSKIQPDGLIHPRINQCVTRTGRLSSSDPNSQNMPRGNTSPIKTCIIPTLDYIMGGDLSQIEWRGAGELSGDEVIIHEVNTGVDQHIATVRELMEMKFISKKDPESKKNRDSAKVFNFRMIYGGTEWGFFLDVDMPDFPIDKWRDLIKAFFKKYATLKKWQDKNITTMFRKGRITIPTGRYFVFTKDKFDKDGVPTYSINHAKNYPIQGLAGGDALPLAAVIIRRGMLKHGLKSKMILTVHDSIIFDVLKAEIEKMKKLIYGVLNNLHHYMASYFEIEWHTTLEGEVEIGKNYGEMEVLSND
jgi:DNA polymerase-1